MPHYKRGSSEISSDEDDQSSTSSLHRTKLYISASDNEEPATPPTQPPSLDLDVQPMQQDTPPATPPTPSSPLPLSSDSENEGGLYATPASSPGIAYNNTPPSSPGSAQIRGALQARRPQLNSKGKQASVPPPVPTARKPSVTAQKPAAAPTPPPTLAPSSRGRGLAPSSYSRPSSRPPPAPASGGALIAAEHGLPSLSRSPYTRGRGGARRPGPSGPQAPAPAPPANPVPPSANAIQAFSRMVEPSATIFSERLTPTDPHLSPYKIIDKVARFPSYHKAGTRGEPNGKILFALTDAGNFNAACVLLARYGHIAQEQTLHHCTYSILNGEGLSFELLRDTLLAVLDPERTDDARFVLHSYTHNPTLKLLHFYFMDCLPLEILASNDDEIVRSRIHLLWQEGKAPEESAEYIHRQRSLFILHGFPYVKCHLQGFPAATNEDLLPDFIHTMCRARPVVAGIMLDSNTAISRQFGFAIMENQEDAKKLVACSGVSLLGSTITFGYANDK